VSYLAFRAGARLDALTGTHRASVAWIAVGARRLVAIGRSVWWLARAAAASS
jgi:hypothetical protein